MTDTPTAPTAPHDARAVVVERRLVHDGFNRFELLTVEMGVNGRRQLVEREVFDHGHAVAVLAYDALRRTTLLVRQTRASVLVDDGIGRTLEVPAGLIDAGEAPEVSARREAAEEIGVTLAGLDFVAACYASPGSLTERVWLYLGEIDPQAPRAAGGGLAEEHEDIEVIEISLPDLADLMDRGGIHDMKTLILAGALRHRRPELFS